jgi:hypothetical protein
MFLLTLALACSNGPITPQERPDIVIVALNGLRADPPGQPYAEQAFIQGLGTPITLRHRAAYAQSVQPYVSLASLLTGRYPNAIPVCGRTGRRHQSERKWCTRLPDDRPSLPEVLALYGYQTALATAQWEAGADLAEEFQTAMDAGARHARTIHWDRLTKEITAWWQATEGPRFLTVALAALERDTLEASAGLDPREMLNGPDDAQRTKVHEAYVEMAGKLGQRTAAMLAALPHDRPRWVVITSAHGLSIAELSGSVIANHAASPTHNLILDRTVRVPLLLIGPAAAGEPRQITHPVQLIDLVPTLARLAGAVQPAELSGHDLLGPAPPDPFGYSEYGDMLGLRSGPFLLTFRSWNHGGNSIDPQVTEALLVATVSQNLRANKTVASVPSPAPAHHRLDAPRPQTAVAGPQDFAPFPLGAGAQSPFTLYNVESDPMQTQDLTRSEPDTVQRLHAQLTTLRTGPAAPPEEAMSQEQVQALRNSGATIYW